MHADEARNQYRSDGRIDESSFSGTIDLVPEPGSALLMLLGAACLIATAGTRHGSRRVGKGA